MINKKDLRIGNIVLYFGDKRTVEAMDLVTWDFEQIDGIPITIEWLRKFGFKIYNESSASCDEFDIYWYSDNKIRVYIETGDHCPEFDHIHYVHTLQNFYFALTGKDLEYNDNL